MSAEAPALDRDRILTLTGIAALVVIALTLDWDVGFVAVSIAVVLSLLMPHATKGAADKVAWPTVLLICGIVTYVALLQEMGTIDWLGKEVAGIGTPLLAALVICFIGGAVSAFASTTGILGALIPLAVPFLAQGEIGAVGMIIALSISSSVVDSSPFSTSGALVVANSPDDRREFVYKRLLQWGMSMIIVAPVTAWAIFVLPGWL
jgi:di/tricarboxylate transporter